MNGPEGVLEAYADRSSLGVDPQHRYRRSLILPVGHASATTRHFSPQAVRRLVDEAKKHFEVIMIDTGPILGSDRGDPVRAACDGVIFAVARGQQRPMVEKAPQHLGSNRWSGRRGVQPSPGQRLPSSISGMSMPSPACPRSSNGNGNGDAAKEAGGYGPVARAVATGVRSGD